MNGEGISLVGPTFPFGYIGGLPANVIPFANINGILTSQSNFGMIDAKVTFNMGLATSWFGVTGTLNLQGAQVFLKVRNTATTPAALGLDGVLLVTTGAGAFTVNLPSSVGLSGAIYTVKKIDAGAGQVTIDGSGAETIDGALTYVLAAINKYVTIVSDTVNWQVIANN